MHFLERYALSCGVKIGKPYIRESFFPNIIDKYVTFHPTTKPAKTYDYWAEVLWMINPILDKEKIRIFLIGHGNERPYNGVINLVNSTTINQIAYLLRTSLLHFGADSFPAHIASYYDIPIVTLYANNHINCVKPYFGNKNKNILIEPDRKTKPNFVFEENPKSINLIKPEKVAQSILDLLNIKESINCNTLNFGVYFNFGSLELVPNQTVNPNQFGVGNVAVRMDYEFNEDVLNQQLNICPCVITTNKPINSDLLIFHKKNIQRIFYEIDENSDSKFVDFLQKNTIDHQLITHLSNEALNKIKLDYFDYDQIVKIPTKSKNLIDGYDINKLYYRSNKRLLSNGKIYASKASWRAGNDVGQTDFFQLINSDDFWLESEHFYIFYKH